MTSKSRGCGKELTGEGRYVAHFEVSFTESTTSHEADRHRSERSFELGDWVFVKFQPYRQQSVVQRSSHNISPKYYEPYKIIDKIGPMAYRLQLPSASQVHPVFHVSQLKRLVGTDTTANQLHSVIYDISIKEPEFCLARKMVQRQAKPLRWYWFSGRIKQQKRRCGSIFLI